MATTTLLFFVSWCFVLGFELHWDVVYLEDSPDFFLETLARYGIEMLWRLFLRSSFLESRFLEVLEKVQSG